MKTARIFDYHFNSLDVYDKTMQSLMRELSDVATEGVEKTTKFLVEHAWSGMTDSSCDGYSERELTELSDEEFINYFNGYYDSCIESINYAINCKIDTEFENLDYDDDDDIKESHALAVRDQAREEKNWEY